MSDDRQAVTFRIRPETNARLREMAELTDRTMVSVVELAIKFLHEHHFLPIRQESEKRAYAGIDLVERLEERLGPQFWRHDGVNELTFGTTDEGQVVVVAGEQRYLEAKDGRLLKARVRGGQLTFEAIEEDGSLGDPMAVPVGDPALN
jgi:predicted transcriptional regulator